MLIPSLPLTEIESKVFKFKSEINGNSKSLFWWKKYNPKSMPLIIKSKKPLTLTFARTDKSENEKYVGILNPDIGRIYYKVEEKDTKEENKLIFTIYGIIKQKGNELDMSYFSPAVKSFLLKKEFMNLVDMAIEKEDIVLTVSKFLINLYEKIKNFSYKEFIEFCRENNLKHILIMKDDLEFLVPFNFITEENYKYFYSFFYLSLLFWLMFGNLEIRIIE